MRPSPCHYCQHRTNDVCNLCEHIVSPLDETDQHVIDMTVNQWRTELKPIALGL